MMILFIVCGISFLIGIAGLAAVFVYIRVKKKKNVIDDELRLAKEIIASGVNYYK